MKKFLYALLILFLISCSGESDLETSQIVEYEDEDSEVEYEDEDSEVEYEDEDSDNEYDEDSEDEAFLSEDEDSEEEYEDEDSDEEYEEDSEDENNDEESLYDEYGEWDKGTAYYDTSSTTSSGWYLGQGTDREEHVHEGMETSDGGFIAIGHHWEKDEDPTGFTDMIVIKTDSSGKELWQKIIGTYGKFDVGYAVNELTDGYVVGGGIYNNNNQKAAILKLDFNGNIIWEKIIDHPGVGGVRGIEVLPNDEIVFTGYKEGDEEGFLFISDGSKGFITKISSSGQLVWDKYITAMQGTKVKKTSKGGFVVGSVEWVDAGLNASMHYLDSEGNTTSTKLFGGQDNNVQLFDMDITDNDYIVFTGHTTGFQTANWDCIVMLIDDQGNEVWKNIFGNPRGYDPKYILDECYGVRVTLDGGFVVTGGTGDHSDYYGTGHPTGTSDDWKVLLSEFDKDGTMTSINVFGGGFDKGNDAGEFIDVTSDGSYIVFTDTDSKGSMGPNNFGLLKISKP